MIKIKKHSQDHLPRVIEYLVILVIVLVIVQTILEELSAVYHWSHDSEVILIWGSMIFDLFFTLEFISRSIVTFRRGEFGFYFRVQRGWIDFMTSIPLLFLVSGPTLIALLVGDTEASGGAFAFLSVLKTAKAIRVTRILRLIRVLKILGKIQNAESIMTNRHVATIATQMVVCLVVVLVVAQYIPFLNVGDRGENFRIRQDALIELIEASERGEHLSKKWLQQNLATHESFNDVIRIRRKSTQEILYTNDNAEELIWTAYDGGAFKPIAKTGYEFQLSYHMADAVHARMNLFVLVAILAVVFVLMIFYSRIFAQQVADPIYIMNKGLRYWDYNLEVRVDLDFEEDEIYSLAKAYNERWLTVKNQIRSYRMQKGGGAEEKSAISLDDVF